MRKRKLLDTEKGREEKVAGTALARKVHGIEDTGVSSIKRHSEGASQLDEDDAWVVSVVLEHFHQRITGAEGHGRSMFGAATVGKPNPPRTTLTTQAIQQRKCRTMVQRRAAL